MADTLEEEANKRREHAKRNKAQWLPDMQECYFFAAPNRMQMLSSDAQPSTARGSADASLLQTSVAFVDTEDFVTEVVNTYLPEAIPWCERGRGMLIPQKVWKDLEPKVRDADMQIFEAIKASNLYSELPKAFNPDLAIGTVGLWIDIRRPHEPINVQAVPLREIETSLGPDGRIDDRFAIRWTRNCYVKALLPQDAADNLPGDVAAEIEKDPQKKTQIIFGFWRLWDEPDEVWQHIILVNKKLVHQAVLTGEGSCPFIVGRFNPSADWPWGIGPLIKGLPDLRQIDELEAQKMDNIELSLNPPLTYPSESFANVEQGIEPGAAYPVQRGDAADVKAMYTPPNATPETYQHDTLEKRLRKIFFCDYPEQSGDTPPTLGQWMDQLARAQRRIGTPGLPFWREVCAEIFLRFNYLLTKTGFVDAIKVDGRVVSLRAYNPAQRAAEQQEITMAVQSLQIISQTWPEEFKAYIDGKATMDALLSKMRVTLVKFRDEKQVQHALGIISQLVKSHMPTQNAPQGAVPA